MGIIAKQSVKGSIYTYAGAFLGFVSTGILMPKLFATDQVGLTQILISYALMFAQFSNLGFTGVFTRLFPYFRNESKGHNGILTLGFIVSMFGFLLIMIAFFLSRNYLIESNIKKSALFSENIYYLIPLIFFTVYFLLLDSYNSSLYDASLGVFLRDFLTKFINLVSIIVFYFNFINFSQFVFIYVLTYILPTFILTFILSVRKHFHLVPMNLELMKEMKNELIFISLFGIISGFSGIALSTVDNLLVNQFLGLKDTGIYVTAFFFGTLISLPSKVLRKISGIVLANAWKIEDTKTISTTYEKSTVTQFIIGSILFIGLWINIDTVFAVIPKYAAGKYVILFIALANLIEMFSGVSSMVILSSKHYRMFSMQMLASLIILVGFNILLIPRMGINGAGLTAIITTFSFALVRFTFIRRKFKIQPYSLKHLKILGIAALVLCFNYLIPQIRNHYIDFFVRSSAVTVVFSLLIYFSRTAEDINKIALQIFDKIRKYLPH